MGSFAHLVLSVPSILAAVILKRRDRDLARALRKHATVQQDIIAAAGHSVRLCAGRTCRAKEG